MGQTARFQETLRRLAMIDEGFVEDEARLGLGLAGTSALDPRTTALLQVAASVAGGSSAVCLEWCAARALAAQTTRLSPATGAIASSTSAISSSVALEEPDDH